MVATFLLALAATSLAALADGAPYLGGSYYVEPYVYVDQAPLVYQNTPYQGGQYQQVFNIPQHSVVSPAHRVYHVPSTQTGQLTHSIPEQQQVQPEINQFHSEDASGRVLYGFHGHNQARMEARDAQGRVRGSYSYVDPTGHVVRMDYWDDGSGFQARGRNVPKVTYDVPGYTPEVQAAREEHFKLYQQILLSTVHAQLPDTVTDDYPYVDRPDGVVTTPLGQDEDDTVEVGVYPERPNDLPEYPGSMRHPSAFQQPFQFQNEEEEDRESIALDNPEFQDLSREGKSLEIKDNKEEGSNQKDKVDDSNKDKKEDNSNKEENKDKSDGDDKKDSPKKEEKKEEKVTKVDDKIVTEKIDDHIENQKPHSVENHNGFFYHFQHSLGTPVNVQTSSDYQKVSSIAASQGLPLQQTTSIHSVHPLPLHTMTGFGQSQHFIKSNPEPAAIHDVQMSPHQTMHNPTIGQPLLKSFQSPVSAVHDSQVPRGATNYNEMKTEHH